MTEYDEIYLSHFIQTKIYYSLLKLLMETIEQQKSLDDVENYMLIEAILEILFEIS